jgi:hypothetical protein
MVVICFTLRVWITAFKFPFWHMLSTANKRIDWQRHDYSTLTPHNVGTGVPTASSLSARPRSPAKHCVNEIGEAVRYRDVSNPAIAALSAFTGTT